MVKPETIEKIFKTLVLLCLFVLSAMLLLLYRRVNQEDKPLPPQILKEIQKVDVCGTECKKEIAKEVAKLVPTPAAIKKETKLPVPAATQSRTAYIPLAGPITSTSTNWVDTAGTDVYIDLAGDYGQKAKVSWEASLSVAHGNGQAYARLFDVTHGIGVSGSEISTTNNAASQLVASGDLNLWAGRNLYRVQIKSLNSFEVTFGNGRIKIVY